MLLLLLLYHRHHHHHHPDDDDDDDDDIIIIIIAITYDNEATSDFSLTITGQVPDLIVVQEKGKVAKTDL